MSLNVTVTVDDEWLQKKLKRMSEQMKPEAQKAVNVTTIKALTELKTILINKNHKEAAISYRHKKMHPLMNAIYSGYWFAKEYEEGMPKRTIFPRKSRGKKASLVFPISKTGKTKTGVLSYTQVKKYIAASAKRKAKIKAGAKREDQPTLKDLAKTFGIAFSKKVKHPGFSGRWTIRDTVAPHARKTLREELFKVFGRVNK